MSLLLAFALACAEPDVDPAFCDDLAKDGCMDAASLAACDAANAECPGEVLVMESCPLQFGCP